MKQQRGVALILALLVVALATTAAVALTSDQQLSLRRAGNMLARDQALQYAIGAESWAQLWLQRDFKDNKVDHEGEPWATEIPPLPVEGGVIVARMFDLQGRFNINNLLDNNAKISKAQLERLKNLLAAVDVPVSVADSAADWIDADLNTTGSSGAEDDYYLNLEHAYRTANQPMYSPTEFRLLKEVDAEMITKLKSASDDTTDPRWIITALPFFTEINVNTAPAPVLQSLGLSQAAVTSILEQRDGNPEQENSEGEPFNDINAFTSIPAVQQANIDVTGLTVSSQFFLLTIQVKIARSQAVLYSIIFRDSNGKTAVINRSNGTL